MPLNRLYITNDYSILSKYSAANLGYFQDPLLLRLVEKTLEPKRGTRRTPLVNIGYANRVLVVDHKVSQHINSDEVDCVVVLGSGFDTLTSRNIANDERNNTNRCIWIEIDLPQVIANKANFLAHEWNLPPLQHSPDVITFKNKPIYLISCDIRSQDELSSKLSKVFSSLRNQRGILILNEVCLNYMETTEVQRVVSTIDSCIKNRASTLRYLGFEQVRPDVDDPFTKIMIEHFESIGHPLRHFQTRGGLENLFIKQLEFSHLEIESVHKLYRDQNQLKNPLLHFHFDREPFDEFEELDMYMAHYAVVSAKKTFIKLDRSNHEDEQFEKRDDLEISSGVEIKTDCILEEADAHIRRYAHSVCILTDKQGNQSVFVAGGFGVLREGGPHRRLVQCMIVSRKQNRSENSREQQVSLDKLPSTLGKNPFLMHGQSCCMDPERKILIFCGGRGSPYTPGQSSNAFIARITSEYALEHLHSFAKNAKDSLNEINETSLEVPISTFWRHRIVRRYNDAIQLGGLPFHTARKGCSEGLPIITYQMDADKLGFATRVLQSVEPRHSFGADMRDNHTVLLYGGLKMDRALNLTSEDANSLVKSTYVSSDRDIRPAQETLLYDFRIEKLARRQGERCSSSYGMQVHFVNDDQFVRVGGVSTATGLAEQSIELFDLRRLDQGPVVRIPIRSKHNDIMLCNSQSVKFESSKEIVTFGGGGNCFTFGTHLNKSQIIYNYAQLASGGY